MKASKRTKPNHGGTKKFEQGSIDAAPFGANDYPLSKRVVRGLDSFYPQVHLALCPVMCGVDEHVDEHRSAVGIRAALPSWQMPFAFELLRCDRGKNRDHIIE